MIDPFNGVWMAMAVSIAFMIPIIMLSTSLRRLYSRTHGFTKYTVSEPTNEATFATDNIYNADAYGYGGLGVPSSRRHKPSGCISHYAVPGDGLTANYAAFQRTRETFPPPYPSSATRG